MARGKFKVGDVVTYRGKEAIIVSAANMYDWRILFIGEPPRHRTSDGAPYSRAVDIFDLELANGPW